MTHEAIAFSVWFSQQELEAAGINYLGEKTTAGRANGGYGGNIIDDEDPVRREVTARKLAHIVNARAQKRSGERAGISAPYCAACGW
jgi:hypothetical protein